jgi:hypothetical protein
LHLGEKVCKGGEGWADALVFRGCCSNFCKPEKNLDSPAICTLLLLLLLGRRAEPELDFFGGKNKQARTGVERSTERLKKLSGMSYYVLRIAIETAAIGWISLKLKLCCSRELNCKIDQE